MRIEICRTRICAAVCAALLSMAAFGCEKLSPRHDETSRTSPASRRAESVGCDLEFEGSDRKAVKLRDPLQSDYRSINGGRPISVTEWFSYVCAFDEDAPSRRNQVPQDRPMEMERHKVTLRAYILAVRREDDNDFHVQVGDRREWDQEQVVVEVPPGATYCDARNAISSLLQRDGARGDEKTYIFRDPPAATITGFVFLDSAHIPDNVIRSDYCRMNGNRGIKNGLAASPVRGLWEVHPVIKVETGGTPAPSSVATDKRPSPNPASDRAAPTITGQIIGNKNSQIYHLPDCPDYQKTTEKNRVYFQSKEDAEKAGFRKARNCP